MRERAGFLALGRVQASLRARRLTPRGPLGALGRSGGRWLFSFLKQILNLVPKLNL
jgi:hypothetical protein